MGTTSQYETTIKAIAKEADGLHPSKPDRHGPRPSKPYFTGLQWSADGTTLFTTSSAKRVSSYVLPSDLLDTRPEPIRLRPSSTIVLSESSAAIAPCPDYSLADPSSHLILTAASHMPIEMHQLIPHPYEKEETEQEAQTDSGSDDDSTSDSDSSGDSSSSNSKSESESSGSAPSRSPLQPPSTQVASYPLKIPENESYPKINSLIWPCGHRFIAGTKRMIAIFDINHGKEPAVRIQTDRGTHRLGKNGIVSALAMQPNSAILAAGTYSRKVALYDADRAGECVSTWDVSDATARLIVDGLVGAGQRNIGGNGVVQTVWSPCGQYLVVNERKSDGLLVYDLRNTHEILSCLVGRPSDTNQRINCDVYQSASGNGFEVWAGGQNGSIAVWEDIGSEMGYAEKNFSWDGHGSAVCGTGMHSSGSVLATCSGHWDNLHGDNDGPVPFETSLKVWSISSGGADL